MSQFIAGEARTQATLFPEQLDDYVTEENAVRVIDVFIDGLNLSALHYQMKTIKRVSAEMSLHVLAYNLKRVIMIMGTPQLIKAMRA